MILKHLAKLIQDYMELPDGKVYLSNEKIMMPTDGSFHITLNFLNLKAIGHSRTQKVVADVMSEEIATNMYGVVAIDIFGRTFDVVTRKEEIIQAFNSTVCRESQLKNCFMVASMPTSFNNISEADGSAILYRFQSTFAVQFISTTTKNGLDYYDNFRKEQLYVST